MGCVLTPPGLAPIAHLKPRIVSAEISCRGSPRTADAAACGTHVGHAADQPSPPVSPAQDARGGRGGSRLASPSTPRDTRLRDPPHPPPLGPIRNPPYRRRVPVARACPSTAPLAQSLQPRPVRSARRPPSDSGSSTRAPPTRPAPRGAARRTLRRWVRSATRPTAAACPSWACPSTAPLAQSARSLVILVILFFGGRVPHLWGQK